MEYILSPDTKKLLLYLGLSFGVIFTVFSVILAKAKGAIKPYFKSILLYTFLFAIGIGITSYISCYLIKNNLIQLFIFLQIGFLGWGILHRYLLPKYMKWHTENTFGIDILFSICIGFLGVFFMILVFRIEHQQGMEWYLCSSFLFFLVPILVLETYQSALSIPPKIFKLWYYPVALENELYPDEKKLKNMLIISFEFKKKEEDPHFTNFRAKAPNDMEMGELFYYFLNDYNERHSSEKIKFLDQSTGRPYGWLFYKKPKWYSFITSYIDMNKTTFINGVKENDIIVCLREY